MRKAIFVIALIGVVIAARGQFSISGVVLNEEGEALTGATVYFDHSYKGTVTDAGGTFQFKNLPAGKYIIFASFVGYETQRLDILLDTDWKKEIRLIKSPFGLEEVIVQASRAGVKDPVAVDLITEKDIESRNLGQDIPILLSMSPSLVSSSDAGNGVGYSGFRIRGTDANRINITVDGVPLNDAESHGVWWVNLPDLVSSVEDIQVQRGVGTSTNGAAAFGASVNIRTTSLSREPYAGSSSGFGSFNTWKTSNSIGTGLMDNGFSFDARYSLIGSGGYIDRASTALRSMYATAGYYSEKNVLKFSLISGKEKTYQAWDGVPSYILPTNRRYNGIGSYTDENGNIQYYENETDNYSQDHMQLHFTRDIGKGMWFNMSLHYTHGAGYYEQYREDEDLEDYDIPPVIISDTVTATDLIRQKWLDNDFYGTVLSFNYRKEKIHARFGAGYNRYVGDHFGEIIWARFASNTEKDYRWYESQGIKSDLNTYGKINLDLNPKLSLFGDLQLRRILYSVKGIDDDLRDITQEHDFLFFNPKFGLNFYTTENQRAYFSLGVSNREPNRDNFVDADPSGPSPVHETLYDYELGYNLTTGRFKAEVNFYYMDYINQLVLTGEINDVGAPVMSNVKNSYRTGIELSMAARFLQVIEWNGNITLSRNRILDMTGYVDNLDYWEDPVNEVYQYVQNLGTRDIAFSPSITAASLVSAEIIPDLNISLQSKYVGKQYIDNTSSDERSLDPWFANDLILNYRVETGFLDDLSFNFMIINLFDHKYESNAWIYRYYLGGIESSVDGYFPQAGIHFMSGITVRF